MERCKVVIMRALLAEPPPSECIIMSEVRVAEAARDGPASLPGVSGCFRKVGARVDFSGAMSLILDFDISALIRTTVWCSEA